MKRKFLRSRHILTCVMSIVLAVGTLTTTASAEPAKEIDPNKPMVALTYDDGPYSPSTNRILDALEAVGGRATFFVVGNRVAGCASVIRRANELGCQIGNHTWDHTDLTTLSASDIQGQIAKCNEAVAEVTGQAPTMLRPVCGCVNSAVCDAVDEPMILWSIDTLDWMTKDPNRTYQTVMDQVQDGDIILMHDLFVPTAEASERIIPALVERGFQLVTVEELAYYRGHTPSAHTTYTRFQ